MSTDPLTQQLWLQYQQAFTDTLQLEGIPQLLSPPSPWDWGGKNPPIGSLPFVQVNFLNQVPLLQMGNANNFGQIPGFGEQYNLFLGQIATDNGGKRGEMLAQKVTNAVQSLAAIQQGATVAYKNFLSGTGSSLTYQEWLKGPGLANADQVSQAQSMLNDAKDALNQFKQSLKGPIADALTQYTKGLINVVGQGSVIGQKLPGWQTSENPLGYANRITGNNFGGTATMGNAMSFSFNNSTKSYTNKSVYGDINFSFFDFFAIEAGGTYKKVTTSSFSSSYSIDFSFEDITPVDVFPGNWYNPAIPDNFKNGPFQPGHSGFQSGDDIFYFGRGGNLSRIITGMIIGYRPKIVIEAGEDFAESLQTELKGGGALIIGPFAFKANASSSTNSGTVTIVGSTITANGKGDWGNIVGLVTNWVVLPPG